MLDLFSQADKLIFDLSEFGLTHQIQGKWRNRLFCLKIASRSHAIWFNVNNDLLYSDITKIKEDTYANQKSYTSTFI